MSMFVRCDNCGKEAPAEFSPLMQHASVPGILGLNVDTILLRWIIPESWFWMHDDPRVIMCSESCAEVLSMRN